MEETFIKDNPTPTVVEKESGEKNYVPLRGYISDIKGWYENVSLALGLVLVAIVLAVIPNNFLKQVLRLSPDLHEEVRNDFPRFYKFIRKTGEPTFYKVILIGVSSFALYWVWNQYPLEYVVQVDLFLNTLKK
ncbi:hypothetical protein [Pontibacillus yanchengensis]|uniref:hypothetical protein n=1 Tax=Pontibacillus yanchengensis TaxID=462910 RepID=UPI00126A6225|nr:hypothetical protein [Pontibacillus yanchengensis]